jgi:hypothetical protein
MYGFYGDDKSIYGFCGDDKESMGFMVMIKKVWVLW